MHIICKRITVLSSLLLGIGLFSATSAQAQATRTWVSGVGDDANPCSRTAPCKTFAGAISKTAPGGEINCLDPGGYGTLTITKSITIDCTGTFGSVLNSGGVNGFIINDSLTATPGTIQVRLRGLTINGAGSTPGLNGIRFLSGASLVVEDVFIQNQRGGNGILINPSAGVVTVAIHNTSIHNSGSATGSGIEVRPTGSASARVSLRNVRITNYTFVGFRVDSSATTGAGVTATAENIETSGGNQGISAIAGAGPATLTTALLDNATVFSNSGSGIIANGAGARIRVATTMVTGNGIGVNRTGGSFINDQGGNVVQDNVTNGSFN